MNKRGFTLIELIMVIVILGVLAAVALPKFYNLTAEAEAAAEAGIFGGVKAALAVYYADGLVKGISESSGGLYPMSLEDVNATAGSAPADNFFYGTGDGILRDPVRTGDGWSATGADVYKGPEGTATYTYTPGTGKFTKS